MLARILLNVPPRAALSAIAKNVTAPPEISNYEFTCAKVHVQQAAVHRRQAHGRPA
jgi:hypothetical protein